MKSSQNIESRSGSKAAANNSSLQNSKSGKSFLSDPAIITNYIDKYLVQKAANFELGTIERSWNLAEEAFDMDNEAGLTVPVLNGEELRGGITARQAAEFLDSPRIGGIPRRRLLRRSSRRMDNTMSYRIYLPTPDPWTTTGVDGSQIEEFLSSNNQILDEDIGSQSGLTFTVVGYPDNETLVNETRDHELEHANDLEDAFHIIQEWDSRITEMASLRRSQRPRFYGRHALYEELGGSPEQILGQFFFESNRLSEDLHNRIDPLIIADTSYNSASREVTMVLTHRNHRSSYLGLETETGAEVLESMIPGRREGTPRDFEFPTEAQPGELEELIENFRNRRPGSNGGEQGETGAPEIQEKKDSSNPHTQQELKIGRTDDEYEKEADMVANRVMAIPDSFIQKHEYYDRGSVQRKMMEPFHLNYENSSEKITRNNNNRNPGPVDVIKPVKISQSIHDNFIQRRLNYLAQITGPRAVAFLTAFDNTVSQVERSLVGVRGQTADDIRASMARARALRTAGRVTIWQVSGSLAYASYDNASGELRLHDRGSIQNATERGLVIHEAIHALHASQYPHLSRLYGQMLAAGGTRDRNIAIILIKFKAWTEYWAYRRSIEHHNIIDPQNTWDPHNYALSVEEVREAIARATRESGPAFTPWTWTPPGRIPGVRRRRP
jgi:hypothetical protein